LASAAGVTLRVRRRRGRRMVRGGKALALGRWVRVRRTAAALLWR
jgi:hypothetical protein